MKAYDIKNENDMIEYLINNTKYQVIKINVGNKTQLRNCYAWSMNGEMYDKETGEIKKAIFLQSWWTIVAVIVDDKCHTWKKYSSSTSRQITWFKRQFNCD